MLMSDNGRVLASITEDSLGWHDSICGHTTRKMTNEKYGKTSYQEQGNDFTDAAKKTSRLNLSATIWVKEILYHA